MYEYKSQVDSSKKAIERHFRKLWHKAIALEKTDVDASKALKRQYWKELRQYKNSYISIK